MIIIKISGGLGNQLFQYAVGRAVSDNHKVPLKLDITAYESYKLHSGYQLDQFDIVATIATKKEISNFKGSNILILKLLRRLGLFNNKSFYREKYRTIYDEHVFVQSACYLDGYWQNERYFLNIRDKLLKEIQPKIPISLKALSYYKEILGVNSVSLHVRRGDYLNHPEIGTLSINYYRKAIKFIANIIHKPRFFIFSDDLAWCKKYLDFIESPVYIENTQTEIDDLILMSKCQCNIIANSSFSWWGAWLNENKTKKVIAPKKWMKVNPHKYKWVPSNWIEL